MKKITVIILVLHSTANVICETHDEKKAEKYDPTELLLKIFNVNGTIEPKSGSKQNFVNFNQNKEDTFDTSQDEYGLVKFDNDNYEYNYNGLVANNELEGTVDGASNSGHKRKRRRRRKPKQHYGLLDQGSYPPVINYGYRPPYSSYTGQYYRPLRRRPSLASEALTAVTGALTSIALYDDYQCVPRLLCEAAAGGALGTSGVLQSITGLQPLLTLLSAYGGISNNPLFVFGRAAFLGMSSNGNPASCRYAYPLCPTDPEQLLHYLNNHNGGFFRFFNAPQQGQQNVEQFYNQLTQNYDPVQQDPIQQNYGLYQPNQNYNQQNYGFYNPHQNYPKPDLYSGNQQSYGLAYPYNDNSHKIRFKNNDDFNEKTYRIEKRIQNKPNIQYIDDVQDHASWTFPEENENKPVNYVNYDEFNSYDSVANNDIQADYGNRFGKYLKFPSNGNAEDNSVNSYDRRVRGFSFPESQRQNYDYTQFNSESIQHYDNQFVRDNEYVNHYNNYNTKKYNYNNNNKYTSNYNNNNKNYNYNDNENDDLLGIRTVYVVRGNGDPNKPEVIKLRPGESLQ